MSVNNFKAIFTFIVFLIAEIVVSFPVYIAIPRRVLAFSGLFKTRCASGASGENAIAVRIPLNYVTAPVVAVFILLAAGCIHGEQVKSGIAGSDGVEPLNVMALFICLIEAYMVLSVDRAGVLRFLAFWVATRSGSSGMRLYIAIYSFFFCVGTVIGNDPVILSGVPFLAYFTHETGIDPPTAWIFGQFVIANISSAVLVSSNPTNIVLSGAFSISYFVYTAKVIVPVLAATLVTLPTLLILFRDPKYIPRKMKPITLSPSTALVDPVGGIFGSTILILTLCTLVATSTVHPQLYLVAVPPAVLVLTRDILYDLWTYKSRKLARGVTLIGGRVTAPAPEIVNKASRPQVKGASADEGNEDATLTGPNMLDHDRDNTAADIATEQGTLVNPTMKEQPLSQEKALDRVDAATVEPIADADATHLATTQLRQPRANSLEQLFPTVVAILKIMPFSLVLFSFSLFILVQGLAVTGWVDTWAGWWGAWTAKTGPVGAVFGMGLVSCILCNVFGTNIGATILLTRILQVWIQTSSSMPSPRLQDAAIYTLALGSNYGAFTFSFPASLAGFLWRKLLLDKGIKVKMTQFAKLNTLPCAVAMGVSCSILIGEIYIIHGWSFLQ